MDDSKLNWHKGDRFTIGDAEGVITHVGSATVEVMFDDMDRSNVVSPIFMDRRAKRVLTTPKPGELWQSKVSGTLFFVSNVDQSAGCRDLLVKGASWYPESGLGYANDDLVWGPNSPHDLWKRVYPA